MTTTPAILAANRDSRNYHCPHAAGCGGDGCTAQDVWPIHHVRHRGVFCRLCTSCVLKYHPGSFCTNCFDLLDGSQPSNRHHDPVIHCSSCPSISHTKCLPDPDQASLYICPCCANPNGFSYFPIFGSSCKKARVLDGEEANPPDEWQRTITLEYSKVLLVAARLASASMSRAVLAARIEAEKKAKESVLAKKRAREALDLLFERCKEFDREKPPEVEEMKKKPAAKPSPTLSAAVASQSRVQNREREKWMKVHNPIPLAHRSPVKGSFMGGLSSHVPRHPNHIGLEDKGKVGTFPAPQSSFASEEKELSKVSTDPESAPQMPPPKQDTLVAMANSRSTLSGSPNTASLHT